MLQHVRKISSTFFYHFGMWVMSRFQPPVLTNRMQSLCDTPNSHDTDLVGGYHVPILSCPRDILFFLPSHSPTHQEYPQSVPGCQRCIRFLRTARPAESMGRTSSTSSGRRCSIESKMREAKDLTCGTRINSESILWKLWFWGVKSPDSGVNFEAWTEYIQGPDVS